MDTLYIKSGSINNIPIANPMRLGRIQTFINVDTPYANNASTSRPNLDCPKGLVADGGSHAPV